MRIRQAESDDVPAIERIVEAAYSVYAPRIGRPPAPMLADYEALVASDEVWVGDLDGAVVGILVIRSSDDVLELENVAVDPAHQGHGHGRELIDFAERHAGELGLAAVELYTNETMTENLHLYPRLGYVEARRGVEDGYHRVYFRKALDARSIRG